MKRKFLALLVALVAVLVLPVGVALAAKPTPFTATGLIAVMGITDVKPAGASGRVLIGSESLATPFPITSNSLALAGKFLSLQQKSNELFSANPFDPLTDPSTVVALDGHSKGSFTVVDPVTGATVASGQYELKVSNIPGVCQIYDEGHWSTTGGSALKGRGTVTACLNWDWSLMTFAGWVTFTGTLN